jgi:hypothetical protein
MTRLAERSGRALLVGALTFFAIWTLCYQAALVVAPRAVPTLVVTVVLWVVALGAVVARARPAAADRPQDGAVASVAVLGAVMLTVTTWGLAVAHLRWLALDVAVLAAAAYLVRRWLARRTCETTAPETTAGGYAEAGRPLLWATGWALGLAAAALASVLVHTDADDAYYLNTSTWVAQRGRFPLRDTMLSNDVLPGLQSHTPHVSSIEALFGVLARVLGLEAGTVVYVLAVPVLVLIAVLSLTWLVSDSRIPLAPLALVAATVGLWMSGGSAPVGHYPLRIWQGKIALFAIAVPLLFATGMRLAARRGWRDHLLFGSAVVASVGLSNTAVFLTPVVLAGLAIGAASVSGVRSGLRVAAWVVYPLAVGGVVVLTVPPSPTPSQVAAAGLAFRSSYPAPLDLVPGGRLGLLTATVLALGIGWLGIRDRLLRASALGVLVATGVVLLPPVQHLVAASAGIGPVMWRMWWAIPTPLLAAGVVGAAARVLPLRRAAGRAVGIAMATAAVAFVPLAHGYWIGAPVTGTHWAPPGTWKVDQQALAAARLAERVRGPGEAILAPGPVSLALSGLTVAVHPVVARMYYLADYSGSPAARVPDRLFLQRFANGRVPPASQIPRQQEALAALGVGTICVPQGAPAALRRAEALGFQRAGAVDGVVCYRR